MRAPLIESSSLEILRTNSSTMAAVYRAAHCGLSGAAERAEGEQRNAAQRGIGAKMARKNNALRERLLFASPWAMKKYSEDSAVKRKRGMRSAAGQPCPPLRGWRHWSECVRQRGWARGNAAASMLRGHAFSATISRPPPVHPGGWEQWESAPDDPPLRGSLVGDSGGSLDGRRFSPLDDAMALQIKPSIALFETAGRPTRRQK